MIAAVVERELMQRYCYLCRRRSNRRFSSSPRGGSSSSSGRGEPRFKIPVHVATFTLLLVPCIGFAWYADRFGPDSEQLEERIRERYGQDVAVAHQKNRAMQEFYQNAIKDAEGGTEDDRLSQVLHGGKGEKKRLHAIDKELYGTQAGVETKLQMKKQLETAAAEKKERRRKQRQKKKGVIETTSDDNEEKSRRDAPDQPQPRTIAAVSTSDKGVRTTQLVTLIAVGTLAALTGFFAGGGRRN